MNEHRQRLIQAILGAFPGPRLVLYQEDAALALDAVLDELDAMHGQILEDATPSATKEGRLVGRQWVRVLLTTLREGSA